MAELQDGSETPVVWCWSAKGGTGTTTIAAALAVRTVQGLERAGLEEEQAGGPVVLVDLCGDAGALMGLPRGETPEREARSASCEPDWSPGAEAAAELLETAGQRIAPGFELVDLHDPVPGSVADPAGDRLGALVAALAEVSAAVVVDAGTDAFDGAERVKRQVPNLAAVEVTRNCYLALSRSQQRSAGGRGEVMMVREPRRGLSDRDVAAALDAQVLLAVDWDSRVARGIDAGTLVALLPASLRRMELPRALSEHLAELTPSDVAADTPAL